MAVSYCGRYCAARCDAR